MRVSLALATFVTAALYAWNVHAQDEPRMVSFADHPLTLDGIVGAGTPVGALGASLMGNLAAWAAVGAGVGVNSQGPQLAVLTRVRPGVWERPRRALALPVGLSFSAGPYKTPDIDLLFGSMDHSGFEPDKRIAAFDWVYWLQPDVGFELQAGSGFHLLTALGAAIPVGFSGMHCENENGAAADCNTGYIQGPSKPTTLWTLTVALGAAVP